MQFTDSEQRNTKVKFMNSWAFAASRPLSPNAWWSMVALLKMILQRFLMKLKTKTGKISWMTLKDFLNSINQMFRHKLLHGLSISQIFEHKVKVPSKLLNKFETIEVANKARHFRWNCFSSVWQFSLFHVKFSVIKLPTCLTFER